MRGLSVKGAFALAILLSLWCVPGLSKDKKTRKVDYGRIKVTSNQPDAPIRVDGIERGRTGPQPVLIDMAPGTYEVEVAFSPSKIYRATVDVQAGKQNCLCLNYVRRTIKLPCPYEVEVSAPAVVNDGDLITFVADVGYAGTGLLNYTWTITPVSARIVRGADTNTITVDSTTFGGQNVVATLIVDDGSGDVRCRQMAQATVPVTIPPPPEIPPREFDEFPNLAFDDSKARFDLFAVELQNSPGATGYIFVYGGRTSRPGQVDKLAQRTIEYFVKTRRLQPSQIVVANGGYRDREQYELWLVPSGARVPQPSPTVAPSDVMPPRARPRAKVKAEKPRAKVKAEKPRSVAKPVLKPRRKGDEE